MSEYDDFEDEDETNSEPASEMKPLETGGIKIEIDASALDAMARAVVTQMVERYANSITTQVSKKIDAAVKAAIDAKVTAVIGERADAIIRETLDKPRRKTNAWGNPTGPEVSFGDIIPEIARSYLDERVDAKGNRESYQSDKSPRRADWIIASMVRDPVDKAAKDAAAMITEQARKIVQQQVGRFVAEQMIPAIEVSKNG